MKRLVSIALLIVAPIFAQVTFPVPAPTPPPGVPMPAAQAPVTPAPAVCPIVYICTPKPAAPIVPVAPSLPSIQSAASSAIATLTAPPPACPSSFYGAGATLNTTAKPEIAGLYAIGTPVTKCGNAFQAYSITLNVLTPTLVGKTLAFTSTTTTGAAFPMKQIGPINFYVFVAGGIAAGTTAVKLGTDWGGFASIPLGFWSMKALPFAHNVNGNWSYGSILGRSF